MEITKTKFEEILIETFRMGQKAYQAPSYPIRIWVAEKIQEIENE